MILLSQPRYEGRREYLNNPKTPDEEIFPLKQLGYKFSTIAGRDILHRLYDLLQERLHYEVASSQISTDESWNPEDVLDKLANEQLPSSLEDDIIESLDGEEFINDIKRVITKRFDQKIAERYLRIVDLLMQENNSNDIRDALGYHDNTSVNAAIRRIRTALLADSDFTAKWPDRLPYLDTETVPTRQRSTTGEARANQTPTPESRITQSIPISLASLDISREQLQAVDPKDRLKYVSKRTVDHLKERYGAEVSRVTVWRAARKLISGQEQEAVIQVGKRRQSFNANR
jgi:hypothetical protein